MLKKISLIIVSAFLVNFLWAQTIQISKKRITENGKTYLLHKVKKGQTLYSISKAYGVEINDIVFENPDLLDGIQKGQILKIPVIQEDARHLKKHLVKKGETIYSICRSYHITEDALYKANISLRQNGLQAGTFILIPLKDFSNIRHSFTPNKKNAAHHGFYHKIKPKETLYSLTKQYHISLQELYRLNPTLKTTGLIAGDSILIPQNQTLPSDTIIPRIDSSLITLIDTLFKACDTLHFQQKSIQLLIAIPFINHDFKKIQENNIDFTDFTNLKSYPYLEFYEGILLAIDSLKKYGLNFDITVVNSLDTNSLKQAIQKSPDIFIGPIANKAYKALQPYYSFPKLWIEPFKPDNHLINSSNYFTLLPSLHSHITRLARYVTNYDTVTCIMVSSPLYRDTNIFNSLRQTWGHYALSSQKNFLLKVLLSTHKPIKEVENALSVGRKNFVIFFSDNEPEVSEFISKLRLLSNDYDIHILLLPSWKQFDLTTEYLHRLQALQTMPYYINYTSPAIKNFIQYHHRFFQTMPSRFTFWGFDLTFYFTKAVAHFGINNFKNCLPMFKQPMLETRFHFYQGKSHPQNDYLFILDYTKDYRIKIIPF